MKQKEMLSAMLSDMNDVTEKEIGDIFQDEEIQNFLDTKLSEFKKNAIFVASFVERGKRKLLYHCNRCGAKGEGLAPTYIEKYHCPGCCNDKIIYLSRMSELKSENDMLSVDLLFDKDIFYVLKVNENYAAFLNLRWILQIKAKKNMSVFKDFNLTELVLSKADFLHCGVRDKLFFVFFDKGLQTVSWSGKSVVASDNYSFPKSKINLQEMNFIHDKNYKKLAERIQEKISFDETKEHTLGKAIDEYDKLFLLSKSKTKKKSSFSLIKKEDFKKDLLSYKCKDITDVLKKSVSGLLKKKGLPMNIISYGLSTIEVALPCPKCENAFIKTFTKGDVEELKTTLGSKDNVSIKCPSCGEELTLSISQLKRAFTERYWYSSSFLANIFYWEPYNNNNDFVVIRFFQVWLEAKENAGSPLSYETSWRIEERQRYIVSAKELFVLNLKGKTAGIGSARHITSGNYGNSLYCANTEEELKNIVSKSSLKYSGILDAWGLGSNPDLKINKPGLFFDSSYAYTVWKFPVVEQLLKAGFINIVEDICRYNKTVQSLPNPKGKSIYDILKMTKPVYRLTHGKRLSLSQIQMAQKLWEADNTMTEEEYNIICSNYIENAIIDLKIKYGIRFSRSLEYLDNCYNFQCIPMSEAAKLWADYLGMATTAGYNTKNRTIRFPFSLKREHDVVSFVTSTMSGKCDLEKFKKKAEENAKFNYSFKPLGLIVKGPNSPQEVIDEGMILHHCVSHYVNAIIEGKSIVMFIRKEDAPDEAYYTAELIDTGSEVILTQVKGDMNSDPSVKTAEGKAVIDFIKKWAAFKKLTIKLSFME